MPLNQPDFHISLSERKSAVPARLQGPHLCTHLIDPRLPACSTCVDERAARGQRDQRTNGYTQEWKPESTASAKYQELDPGWLAGNIRPRITITCFGRGASFLSLPISSPFLSYFSRTLDSRISSEMKPVPFRKAYKVEIFDLIFVA